MPADKFSYKPTPDQKLSLTWSCTSSGSTIHSAPRRPTFLRPRWTNPKETDSKDQLVAAVKASYAFCSDVVGKMDDSKLGDSIEIFGGGKVPAPWRR